MAKIENNNHNEDTTRSALSAIAAGILVIIAGFLVYNYFTQSSKDENFLTKIEEQINETSDKIAEQGEQDTADDVEEEKTEEAIEQEQQNSKSEGSTSTTISQREDLQSAWVANDIAQNTISGGEYTVKSGDTLWEIAEGKYGTGYDWVKIRDANNSQIDMLPNGTQALIYPGQVLSLP